MPTVPRVPRLLMFTVAPGTPMDVLMPDLLRFNLTPGNSLIVLRNRNPIGFPSHEAIMATGRVTSFTETSHSLVDACLFNAVALTMDGVHQRPLYGRLIWTLN
jgi:hypothetical protein